MTGGRFTGNGYGNNSNTGNYKDNNPRQSNGNTRQRPKPYCSLCGEVGHRAVDVCYQMKDEGGRVREVIPTQDHCRECEDALGKKLHHPPSVCFTRHKKNAKSSSKV